MKKQTRRLLLAAAVAAAIIALSACSHSTQTKTTKTPAAANQATSAVKPTGPVQMGKQWVMTVEDARAYVNQWNAPTGMPGTWTKLDSAHKALVLSLTAHATAAAGAAGAAGAAPGAFQPQCTLRASDGTILGQGASNWQVTAAGVHQSPMAYLVPASLHHFDFSCIDATGAGAGQASWSINV
jgi:hypothetical protein